MLLAAIILVVGVPMSLVLRTRPEDMGLVPDGERTGLQKPNLSAGGGLGAALLPPPARHRPERR